MPGWLATLIVGTGTTIIQAFLLAYYFGKLSQRVDDHDKELTKVDGRLNGTTEDQRRQWNEINRHGENIAKIKGALGVNGN